MEMSISRCYFENLGVDGGHNIKMNLKHIVCEIWTEYKWQNDRIL
jgi:hypothetical protein